MVEFPFVEQPCELYCHSDAGSSAAKK